MNDDKTGLSPAASDKTGLSPPGAAWCFFVAVFLNAFVDLGHKITIQNTLFKLYSGSYQVIMTGTGIGGEAVFQAGKALKANILSFVARLTESEASLLDIRDGG